MKNFKRKLMMPLMVMAFAIVGAFMTSEVIAGEAGMAEVDGYVFDIEQNECVNMEIKCSDIPTSQLCTTSNNEQLFELQGTSCPNPLYRLE